MMPLTLQPSPLSTEAMLIIGMLLVATLLGLAMIVFFWRVLSKKNAAQQRPKPIKPRQAGVHSVYTRPAPDTDAAGDEQDSNTTARH